MSFKAHPVGSPEHHLDRQRLRFDRDLGGYVEIKQNEETISGHTTDYIARSSGKFHARIIVFIFLNTRFRHVSTTSVEPGCGGNDIGRDTSVNSREAGRMVPMDTDALLRTLQGRSRRQIHERPTRHHGCADVCVSVGEVAVGSRRKTCS